MNRAVKITATIALLFFSHTLWAQKIIWADDKHWPPWYFQGEQSGQGMSQLMASYVMSHLEKLGYTYTFLEMTTPRMIELMKDERRLVCGSDLVFSKTRAKSMLFSDQPSMLALPSGVLFLADKLNAFEKHFDVDGDIVIDQLMRDTSLRVGLDKNRVYLPNKGPMGVEYTDKKNPSENKHVFFRDGNNPAQGFLGMILMNRIDYALGDPYEYAMAVNDVKKQKNIPQLEFRKMSENKRFILSYIVCSKNAEGEKLIAHIDDILKKNRFDTDYVNIFTRYLPSEHSKQLYLAEYQRYFSR